jgi:hypothetical protein
MPNPIWPNDSSWPVIEPTQVIHETSINDILLRMAAARNEAPTTPPPADTAVEPVLYYCERCEAGFEFQSSLIRVRHDRGFRSSQSWCSACVEDYAVTCSDCERQFTSDEYGGRDTNGGWVCRNCAANYFVCDNCDDVCHRDDYGSDGECSECAQRERDVLEHAADAPSTKFGNGKQFFGVELEVEGGQAKAREALNSLGRDFAICKEDGSLYDGFEIVTAPATLDVQRERWARFFNGAQRGLRSFKTETCGLHVHCSRKPLTDLTVAKTVCFVNAAHNRRFMSVIAGRTSERWAQYKAKKLKDVVTVYRDNVLEDRFAPNGTYIGCRPTGETILRHSIEVNESRYEAINLQNRETIEFRIFKGTLKRESLFKAIEFCDALIAFCKPAERSLRESQSRVAFIRFVESQPKRWPHLLAFIQAKWQGRETKLTQKMKYTPVVPAGETKLQTTEEE